MLGTIIDKLTTIVTALQSVATEQQELIYKIEAMTAATYEIPALHPNLPWVIDEQHATLISAPQTMIPLELLPL
jgi:hypothetical protein